MRERVEHLGHVERGLPEVDQAYDGQGAGCGIGHPVRVLTHPTRALDAASSLDP